MQARLLYLFRHSFKIIFQHENVSIYLKSPLSLQFEVFPFLNFSFSVIFSTIIINCFDHVLSKGNVYIKRQIIISKVYRKNDIPVVNLICSGSKSKKQIAISNPEQFPHPECCCFNVEQAKLK